MTETASWLELGASLLELGAVFLLSIEAIKTENLRKLIDYTKLVPNFIANRVLNSTAFMIITPITVVICFSVLFKDNLPVPWGDYLLYAAIASLAPGMLIAAMTLSLIVVSIIMYPVSLALENASNGVSGAIGFGFFLVSWVFKLPHG